MSGSQETLSDHCITNAMLLRLLQELKASFPVLPPTVMPDQVKEDRQLRNHRKLNTQRWFQRGQSQEEKVYVSPLPA